MSNARTVAVRRPSSRADIADTLRPMAESDTTATRLVLIRHGESNVTVNRVIGGHRTCSGLSDLGRRQAERLRQRLEATGEIVPEVLISSNFQRAIETADAIAPAFAGLPVLVDEGFGEHDPGPEIDGMSFDAYVDRFGRPNWSDPDLEVFPGGETIADFHTRVGKTLRNAIDTHRGATVVISCHGGVIDATFRQLLNAPITGGFELHTLNTSVTEFVSVSSGDWRLQRYNDTAHLQGLPSETPRVAPVES
jgi:probable phosphoglycerate mutase